MAGKKTKQLTLEEKLQNALVPKEEQPYKIPNNWCWTHMDSCNNFERGITFPASAKQYENNQNLIICLRTANIQEKLYLNDLIYIDKKFLKNNINKLVKNGDIILSSANSKELVGKTSYINNIKEEMTFGGFNILIRNIQVKSKYIFYYLRLLFLLGEFRKKSTQTTNIANINIKILSNEYVPLAPLNEQQRIVNKIESLFSKLDKAKELIEHTLNQIKQNKIAILHKAFTGELTAKWRKENNIDLFSWKIVSIKDIGDVKGGKRLPKGETLINENTGYPYIKAGNLKKGTVLYNELQYLKPEVYEKIKKYTVKTNDIYITIVGACIGDVGVIPKEVNGANLTENASKITNLKCNPIFLSKQLSSNNIQKQIKNKIASATLGKLSLQNIKNIKIKLPTIEEQQEIVNILDKLLAKYNKIQSLNKQLAQIELLKKSILAKAFRGELGTNDPQEESAEKLLAEILAEN